jgi:hypothetical protein
MGSAYLAQVLLVTGSIWNIGWLVNDKLYIYNTKQETYFLVKTFFTFELSSFQIVSRRFLAEAMRKLEEGGLL